MRTRLHSLVITLGISWASLVAVAAVGSSIDTATQGNWIGVYGTDGYILNDYYRVPTNSGANNVYDPVPNPAADAFSLPSYISAYTYGGGAQAYVWESNSGDTRFPQDPAAPGGPRSSTTVFDNDNWFFELTLSQPKHFQLGVYALDYEDAKRSVTIEVNGDTQVIDGKAGQNYHNGTWALFDLNLPSGIQRVNIIRNANSDQNVTISAITFSSVPEPASIALLGIGALGLICAARRRG